MKSSSGSDIKVEGMTVDSFIRRYTDGSGVVVWRPDVDTGVPEWQYLHAMGFTEEFYKEYGYF